MVRNRKLAKAISDCAWGTFRQILGYKAGRLAWLVNHLEREDDKADDQAESHRSRQCPPSKSRPGSSWVFPACASPDRREVAGHQLLGVLEPPCDR